MKLSEDRLGELMTSYFDQRISAEEKLELWQYVNDPVYAQQIQAGIPDATSNPVDGIDLNPASESRILEHIFGYGKSLPLPIRKVSYWPRIGVAAAVATAILSAGIWFYMASQKNTTTEVTTFANDVAPGKQGATLTLANGQKIRLADASNGRLADESGVTITKTASGQLVYKIEDQQNGADRINMLTTDNGETYQVRLPDGSSVWLNAASTLKYPASFAKLKQRRVELSGEGYFEVAKDRLHPFIVKTAGQEIEVLGTHFNINAYADEPAIATTLLEGAIRVTNGNKVKQIVPGQQAIATGTDLKVANADTETVMDWKDGEFNLDEVDFRVAMRKIARWYDVELIYDRSVPENIGAFGWISRSSKLSSVLKLIENSGQVKFRIEGKKIYIYK